MSLNITIDNFKTFFARDFTFGSLITNVIDSDVDRAIMEMQVAINIGLIPDKSLNIAAMYLTAHFLTVNIRTGYQGIQSIGDNLISSNSQGVSESYKIPERFTKSAIVNYYTKTNYGLKYLSIVLPYAIGNVNSTGRRF